MGAVDLGFDELDAEEPPANGVRRTRHRPALQSPQDDGFQTGFPWLPMAGTGFGPALLRVEQEVPGKCLRVSNAPCQIPLMPQLCSN